MCVVLIFWFYSCSKELLVCIVEKNDLVSRFPRKFLFVYKTASQSWPKLDSTRCAVVLWIFSIILRKTISYNAITMELMAVSNSRLSGENRLELGRKIVFLKPLYVCTLIAFFFLCRSFLESATRILRGSLKIPSSFVYATFWGLFFFLHFLAYDGFVYFLFLLQFTNCWKEFFPCLPPYSQEDPKLSKGSSKNIVEESQEDDNFRRMPLGKTTAKYLYPKIRVI